MSAALVKTRLVGGVVPPTIPVKETFPAPATKVAAWAPLSVLLKLILAPLEVRTLAPVKLTGLGKVKALAPDTVMLLPT